LANIKSAQKRARQTVKRREHNASRRSMLRSAIKKVLRAIESRDKGAATAAYMEAEPVIDRMSAKGIIHANTASRNKSRLSARIRSL
jgi:small subunit ribosomal protein S20